MDCEEYHKVAFTRSAQPLTFEASSGIFVGNAGGTGLTRFVVSTLLPVFCVNAIKPSLQFTSKWSCSASMTAVRLVSLFLILNIIGFGSTSSQWQSNSEMASETTVMFELLYIWEENTVVFVGSFMTTTVNERPHVWVLSHPTRAHKWQAVCDLQGWNMAERLSHLWTVYTECDWRIEKTTCSVIKMHEKTGSSLSRVLLKMAMSLWRWGGLRRAAESVLFSALHILVKEISGNKIFSTLFNNYQWLSECNVCERLVFLCVTGDMKGK